jgi:glutaredoxin-like protein NrdH
MSITVYTRDDCAACTATKVWLAHYGVAYTEIDVSDEKAATVLTERGYTTLPVVIDGGTAWAGFRIDKLKTLLATGAPSGHTAQTTEGGSHA